MQTGQFVGVLVIMLFLSSGVLASAPVLWKMWRQWRAFPLRVAELLLKRVERDVRRKEIAVMENGKDRVATIEDREGEVNILWNSRARFTEILDQYIHVEGRIAPETLSEPLVVDGELFVSAEFTVLLMESDFNTRSRDETGMIISYRLTRVDQSVEEVSARYVGEQKLLELEHDELLGDIVTALERKASLPHTQS